MNRFDDDNARCDDFGRCDVYGRSPNPRNGHNLLDLERSLTSRQDFRFAPTAAFAEWRRPGAAWKTPRRANSDWFELVWQHHSKLARQTL